MELIKGLTASVVVCHADHVAALQRSALLGAAPCCYSYLRIASHTTESPVIRARTPSHEDTTQWHFAAFISQSRARARLS
jgi:hypothetical protein